MAASFPIQKVSERTGLSPHVIRAWERRYGAITPERSTGKHRLYSEAEIERLLMLSRAVRNGHSIGKIANLRTGELREMLDRDRKAVAGGENEDFSKSLCQRALEAVKGFDLPKLEAGLSQAVLTLGYQGLLRRVVSPLAHEVGNRWRSGEITVAHEHFFTAVVKVFLGDISRRFAAPLDAPRIIVCTPAGQLHELGAVIAATEATNLGWRAIYLGPNLPAHEIAGAALRNEAVVVALSIVYPEDDSKLGEDIAALARLLPAGTHLIAGGRAASAYEDAFNRAGGTLVGSLEEFSAQLDAVRRRANVEHLIIRR